MKLADIQAAFQASVLAEAPSPDLLSLFRPPTRAEKIDDVFAVYHDGFRLRMAEFLENDFPVLRAALSDELFGEMAEAFWRAHPSTFRNARWFGARLPEFLRDSEFFGDAHWIAGLAALEAAMSHAFDAEDANALPVAALGVTPAENWPRLRFGFHPSLVLVDCPAESLSRYEAAQEEAEEEAREAADEQAEQGNPPQGELVVLVWRNDLDVNYRALEEWEALALREILRGATFGEACTLLAFARSGEAADALTMEAAGFLARWFADGLIVAAQARADTTASAAT